MKRILMVSENCQGQESIWERERNGPFSSSHTALLSATKDNRQNTWRQDEVLQLIAASVHTPFSWASLPLHTLEKVA